jgi:hypothetical protein
MEYINQMSVYLHDIPLNEAKALFESALADAQLGMF